MEKSHFILIAMLLLIQLVISVLFMKNVSLLVIKKTSRGRSIDRSEFDAALDRNNEQVSQRKNEYKRRQAIVEHPFGTIKRQWGFDYTLLKGFKKVDAESSLIFLAYNFKRCMSIMGKKKMKKALKTLIYYF